MGISVLMFLVTFVYPFSYCFANFSQLEEEAASITLHNPGTISAALVLASCIILAIYFLSAGRLRRMLKGGPHEH